METLNRRRRPSTAAGLVDGVPVEPQPLTTSPQPRRGSLSPHNGDGTGRQQQQAALLSASAAAAARPRGGTAGPWLTEAAGVGVPPERGDFAWVGRLLKRRSGFGKIAAKNWRARCFCATRNGLLLYYEEDTFELVDFSQPPRGVVNLMEGDCTLTTGRMDTDMPTQFPLVIREVGRREQRWKLCAQSQEDLTSLEQVLSDFFKEGASDQRLRSHRRGSKMWSMLPRANSSFSMVGGGSFEGDSQHAGRDVTPGAPVAHFKPALSPLACSPDVRSSRTRRGSLQLCRGGGGGVAGWAERRRGAVYFATLLVVNGSVIALHWLQPPLWGAWFLAAVAAINLAVALGAPQHHGEPSEGAARRVPLVHAHDLPPLVNAVKMMQFTNKNRQALREKQAQADGGGSISPGESFRELPLAGTTVVRAMGKVAGDLTAPQRTWQDGIGSVFNVRGASYLTDRVKAPSAPALYTMVGCDFYATPLRVSNVADAYVSLKDLAAQAPVPPIPDVPGLLVINCQLPSNPPEVFNYSEDGPSYHVILYFAITQETADALKDLSTASPAVKLWARYSAKQADDDEFRGRFKAMCVVENWEATGLSNSFRVYNGKPVLITRTGQTFAGKPATAGGAACLEMDINIHRFRYAAKKVLHNLMEKFQQMVLHVGFTIEGRAADELPEAMLACACLNYGSPDEVDELQTGLDED